MDEILRNLNEQSALAESMAERWMRTARINAGVGGPATIFMDLDGRVVGARLHPQWRHRLAGCDLGAAVVKAVREAQRLLLAGDLRRHPKAATGPADDPAHAPEVGAAEFFSYLRTLLDDVRAVLPFVEASAMQAARQETTVKAANGAVIATTRAGVLIRLRCSPDWLARTGHHEISVILTDVLARAIPGGTAQMTSGMDAVGRVAEFRALMADPAHMLTRLGLPRAGAR